MFRALLSGDEDDFAKYAPGFFFSGRHVNTYPSIPTVKGALTVRVKESEPLQLPSWASHCVFQGIYRPRAIDLMALYETSRMHKDYNDVTGRPTTGHEVLSGLIQEYEPENDNPSKVYIADRNDKIHGCHGIGTLLYLKRNKLNLPQIFLLWAKDKTLCAPANACRNSEDGRIYIPFCFMSDDLSHPIRWQPVGDQHFPSTIVMLAAVKE